MDQVVDQGTRVSTRVRIPAGASPKFSPTISWSSEASDCNLTRAGSNLPHMEVEHVRDTARMRVYRLDGIEVQTTIGSTLESVLKQIKTLGRPYLTSMDLQGDPMRVSGALRALVRRGAIARSPGILSVRGNERFYLYYSLQNQRVQDQIIEDYLEANISDQRITEIFRRVKYGGDVLSNYDIRAEFGAIDLVQLQNYIRNGILGERYVKRHGNSYIDATFWYPVGMAPEAVDQAVKEKLDSSILKRKEAIGKGKEFENSLYAAFGQMFAAQSLQFAIFDHNKQVRKQLAGGRLRIFDMVAYAAPVVVDPETGQQKPVKWFHGSMKIVFEFKYNFRVTKGFLAEYCMDVHEAYGDQAIPAVVAGGDPGFGAVYDSGWQFSKYHNGVWLITGSSLTQVLRGGASSLASQAHTPGEAHEHDETVCYTERTPYGSDEHDRDGPLTTWLSHN